MGKLQAVAMLRRIADAIEEMEPQGWDRAVEAEFPAILGVLQLFEQMELLKRHERRAIEVFANRSDAQWLRRQREKETH